MKTIACPALSFFISLLNALSLSLRFTPWVFFVALDVLKKSEKLYSGNKTSNVIISILSK